MFLLTIRIDLVKRFSNYELGPLGLCIDHKQIVHNVVVYNAFTRLLICIAQYDLIKKGRL